MVLEYVEIAEVVNIEYRLNSELDMKKLGARALGMELIRQNKNHAIIDYHFLMKKHNWFWC